MVAPGKNPFPCLCQILETACTPWRLAPSIFKASNGLASPLHAHPSGCPGPTGIVQENFPIPQSSDLQPQVSSRVSSHTHRWQGLSRGHLECVYMGLGGGVVVITSTTGSSQRLIRRGQGRRSTPMMQKTVRPQQRMTRPQMSVVPKLRHRGTASCRPDLSWSHDPDSSPFRTQRSTVGGSYDPQRRRHFFYHPVKYLHADSLTQNHPQMLLV